MNWPDNEYLDNHIKNLGLKNRKEYKIWCKQKGFSTSLRKKKLVKEQKFFNTQKAVAVLKKNKPKPFKVIIEQLRALKNAKELTTARFEYKSAVHQQIVDSYKILLEQKFPEAMLFLDILLFLEPQSKLINSEEKIRGIFFLVRKKEEWIRQYNSWISKSHNVDKQFSSFIRHLLTKYEVPVFMDNVWTKHSEFHQQWFIHIGSGKNIRTAENLPCLLSKKEAHYFMKAPSIYSIEEAIRWGQIHALGGYERLVSALRETKLIQDFQHNDFCLQVIRFFINHPMLDLVHVNPIVDYIWNQKFTQQRVFVGPGQVEDRPPAQSNFSMTGRDPIALLKQVERWHHQLGKESKGKKLQWEHHSTVKDFEWKQGSSEKKNLRFWKIKQLLSNNELASEGRKMRNCVASYSQSCFKGSCSMWSLRLEDFMGEQILITIELSKELFIRQIRGKFNRTPEPKEKDVIKRWMRKEGLKLASYYGNF